MVYDLTGASSRLVPVFIDTLTLTLRAYRALDIAFAVGGRVLGTRATS